VATLFGVLLNLPPLNLYSETFCLALLVLTDVFFLLSESTVSGNLQHFSSGAAVPLVAKAIALPAPHVQISDIYGVPLLFGGGAVLTECCGVWQRVNRYS